MFNCGLGPSQGCVCPSLPAPTRRCKMSRPWRVPWPNLRIWPFGFKFTRGFCKAQLSAPEASLLLPDFRISFSLLYFLFALFAFCASQPIHPGLHLVWAVYIKYSEEDVRGSRQSLNSARNPVPTLNEASRCYEYSYPSAPRFALGGKATSNQRKNPMRWKRSTQSSRYHHIYLCR